VAVPGSVAKEISSYYSVRSDQTRHNMLYNIFFSHIQDGVAYYLLNCDSGCTILIPDKIKELA
jgi:hypothetical protein